ncbi:hypothetical protein GT755_33140 [Herbidospora sp. NEAU-GS84]|uniref:Uncharacterized protein n=1 Tax=Herbidospora solisilvae TaxID=2696284 RepID=A0A7C9JC16_9ACTN|nr:hypothetical protein [Herbidospora solisilvae]NAS26508.1 hypothetical protein [Herbidospora solisilvae]
MGDFGAAEEIVVEGDPPGGRVAALGRVVLALLAGAVLTSSAAPATPSPGLSPGLEGATPVRAPEVDLVCEGGCPTGDGGQLGDGTSPFPEGYREEDQVCEGEGCAVAPEGAVRLDPFTGEVIDR